MGNGVQRRRKERVKESQGGVNLGERGPKIVRNEDNFEEALILKHGTIDGF